MSALDALLTLAEFSLALAGFTGVVVIFGRGGGDWHPIDSYRIQVALWGSIGPAFLSLISVGLHMLGFVEDTLWRASSLLFILYVILVLGFMIPRLIRLDPDSRALLPLLALVLAPFLVLGTISAQVLNVLGVWFAPQPGVFFLGLIVLLAGGAFAFVRTVFVRPRH